MLSHSTEETNFILLFSEVISVLSFEKRNFGNKLVDARSNLIDMHLIQLNFALLFKVTSHFYKWLLLQNDSTAFIIHAALHILHLIHCIDVLGFMFLTSVRTNIRIISSKYLYWYSIHGNFES